jgi:hypothetical protein
MFEIAILIVSATPFLIGLYAIRMLNNKNSEGSDDNPPPPDPSPPLPDLPPSPESARRRLPRHPASDRGPRASVRAPATRRPVVRSV